jgi:hypothetical protein
MKKEELIRELINLPADTILDEEFFKNKADLIDFFKRTLIDVRQQNITAGAYYFWKDNYNQQLYFYRTSDDCKRIAQMYSGLNFGDDNEYNREIAWEDIDKFIITNEKIQLNFICLVTEIEKFINVIEHIK